MIDANLGGGTDAQDTMRLLLVASLANVPGAVKGLAVPEIVANLCAPDRDVSRLQNEVVARLVTAAWYLHTTNDGRLHVRNVQNLVARVTTTAGAYLRDQAASELKNRLREIFKPTDGWCYQQVAPLPAVDDVNVGADKVTLVVSEPHPDGLHPDLVKLYEQLTYRNRVCFLTGERAFDSLLDRARELRAINQIIAEMQEEGVADGDPQMQQARDQLLPRFLAQFHSAIRESFTTLHYPTRDRLARVDFLMEFRENRYDGEQQVLAALKGKQKYTEDVAGEIFRKKVETRLFTQQSTLWSEVIRRAATQPGWQWHRSDALDRLKQACVHQDRWREEGQYVNKGPFPKPATTVRIQELARDDDTGNVKLRVSPVNGDRVYSDAGAPATPASKDLGGGGGLPDESHAARFVPGGGFDGRPRDRRSRRVDQPHHAEVAGVHGRRRTPDRDPRRAAGADPLHDGRLGSEARRRRVRRTVPGAGRRPPRARGGGKGRDRIRGAPAGNCRQAAGEADRHGRPGGVAPAGWVLVSDHERGLPVHQPAEEVRGRRRRAASGRPGRLHVG